MIKKLIVLVAIFTLVSACTTVPQQRESVQDKSAVQFSTGINPVNKQTTHDKLMNLSFPLANQMGKAYQMQLNCNITPYITSSKTSGLFGNYITHMQTDMVMLEYSKGIHEMKSWKCDNKEITQTIKTLLESIDVYMKMAQPILTDPLEGFNRWMFGVNTTIYSNVLGPVARVYRDSIHENLRTGIKNVFSNAMAPVKLLSSLLQLDFEKSGRVIARTLINTTLGIGGLADVAGEEYLIDDVNEDIDKTLSSFGIPTGPYVILPIFGPSTARNIVGRVVDSFMGPPFFFASDVTGVGILAEENINAASFIVDKNKLKSSALDRYEVVRDFHHQSRIADDLELIKGKEKLNLLLSKAREHLQEHTASPKEFTNSKEPSRKRINELQRTTASLRSELNQIKPKKSKVIKDINQSNTKSKQEELATISKNFSDVSTTKEIASKNLDRWVRAWENQDIESYLSFYSKEFVPTNGRYSDWRVDRIAALKRHANISIQLEKIQIFSSKDTAEINFTQSFKSNRYSDIGIKKLIWVKNGSDWKITKETWKPQY
jgi:phospholipid-binding lipoprotein MlaA